MIEVDTASLQFDTLCAPVILGSSPEDSGEVYYGFASYDNFIEVCELRLDLDYNDSGSRFGPHFYSDPICTRTYPVADRDVWTRSLVGALDSATLRLRTAGSQPGYDRLHYAEVPGIEVSNLGDTLPVADTLITTAGTYQLRRPGEAGCDTLLTLFVSQWPVYESAVDTSLRAGDTLLLADTLITSPGEYAVVLSSGRGCDSTVFVSVDLIDTVRDEPAAFAYRAPTLLRNGETVFRITATPRAAPLRVDRLLVFDVSGRPVHRSEGPPEVYWSPGSGGLPAVPAGIYFYRAAVSQGAYRGWVSGKVVVQ